MQKSRVKKAKEKRARGILDTLKGFVKLLEDMERKGEKQQRGSSQISVLGLPAEYGYSVKLGIEPENFKRGYRRPNVLNKVEIKRVAVNTPEGRVEKDISLVNYKLEGALSKDGTLEIALKRRR